MDFQARRKSSAGKPIFGTFYVYFPSRMRGACVSVESVLRALRATPGDGAWKLLIRYVHCVVRACEQRGKCERVVRKMQGGVDI